jgi:hypothetical protein
MTPTKIIRKINTTTSYLDPSNGVRLIYTISENEPTSTKKFAKLVNGLYLYKVSRTDELLRYTETDMKKIVRVILFTYVFRISPNESIMDLINTGKFDSPINEEELDRITCQELTSEIANYVLDSTLGANFSTVAKFSVVSVMNEYMTKWRYFVVGCPVSAPSVDDYIRLFRFVNVPLAFYTPATKFINTNMTDHKIPLQGTTKELDLSITKHKNKYIK